MSQKYEVFISFKNLDKNGQPTRDAKMAEELYHALEARGIHTFYSNISIDKDGDSDFVDAIDQAIEEAVICVAVGSSVENLKSPWVADELKSFRIEMNNGNKPRERCAMYSYITKDVPTNKLPGKLKSCQVFYELKAIVDAVISRFQKEREVMENFIPKVAACGVLMPGTIMDGKYKILSKIGQGGMSNVYLAVNEKANKHWAVKEVRMEGVRDREVVKKGLMAEIDILKKLNHPALPSVADVIDKGDSLVVIMDYIEGNSLNKALLDHGAQPEAQVVDWAKQLCDVLSYLHSRTPAIIYRDMKPGNIMLSPRGNLTLIDFGTAREYKPGNMGDTVCLGTIGYAAPEQFGGMGQTDARTDIYCLGATLHHLVTGCDPCKPPYELYPIRQIDPELSYGLEYIISKCVQRDPDNRYQSAQELLCDLDNLEKLDARLRKKAKGGLFGWLSRKPEKQKQAVGTVVKLPVPGSKPAAGAVKPQYVPSAAPVFAVTTILGDGTGVLETPAAPKVIPAPAGFAIPGAPAPGKPAASPVYVIPGQQGSAPKPVLPVAPRPVPAPKPVAPVAPRPVPATKPPMPAPTPVRVPSATADPGTAALYDRVAVCLSVDDLPREGGTVEVYLATEKTYGEAVSRIAGDGGYKKVIVADKAVKIHRNDTVTLQLAPVSFALETDAFSFLWGDHVRADSCAGYTFQISRVEDTEDAFLVMTLLVNGRVLGRSLVWFEEYKGSQPLVMPMDVTGDDPCLIRLKTGERIVLNKPVFRLGKEKNYVDYHISDNSAVSRSHADVITRNGAYFLVDTNSVNCTYVDDTRIPPNVETPLRHGALIRLADERFEFRTH